MLRAFKRWPGLHTVGALQLFQVLRQGAVILTALLLTRSSLVTADIGRFEQLLYLGYALSFFWISGLGKGLLTLFPKVEKVQQADKRTTAYLLFLGLSLVVASATVLAAPWLLPVLLGQPELPHLSLFLLYLALYLPAYLLEHFLLLDERSDLLVALGVWGALLYLAGVLVPLWMGFGLRGSIFGLVLFAGMKHALLLVYLWKGGVGAWRFGFVRRWTLLSLPLLGYALLGGFHLVFDNWLVGYHFAGDAEAFAHYRYGARELPLVLALAGALGTAMLPRLATDLDHELIVMRRHTLQLFHLLFPLSIALMLSSPWWFPWLFTEAFRPSVPVFNIFLLITVSRLLFTRPVLMALQDNQVILLFSILELAINVVVSLLLVSTLGLIGIALGTLLAFSAEKLLLVLYLDRRHGLAVARYTPMTWWLAYSVALILAFLGSIPFW